MMKTDFLKYFATAALILISALTVSAQNNSDEVEQELLDTAGKAPVLVDEKLSGTDIMDVLHMKGRDGSADIILHQSKLVEESVRTHIIANKGRSLNGYRIRIFYDNSQDARVNSSGAYSMFLKYFKGIPAYLSYVNPYFKVSVGDFRTRTKAMEKLIHIKRVFPTAFVVKEKIRYPRVDRPKLEDLPDSLEVFKFETPIM